MACGIGVKYLTLALRSDVRSRFSLSGSSLSLGDSMAAERYMYGAEACPVCDFLL